MARWQVRVLAEDRDAARRHLRDDEAVTAFAAGFAEHGGTADALDHSYQATFLLDGDTAAGALTQACEVFTAIADGAAMPAWPLVRVEVARAQQAAADDDHPALMGVSEIARLLNVSPSRASHITHREDFPAPEVELACGPIWRRSKVEGFAAVYRPRVGRPPKRR